MDETAVVYELREYLVSDGRVADELDRARSTILSEREGGSGLFDRHGIPRPWAIWRCIHGRALPSVAFLYAWPGTQARARAFPALYNDPAWVELRARTNGPQEIVERIDDLLFTGPPLPPSPKGGGAFEFVRHGEQDAACDDDAPGTELLAPLIPLCGRDVRPLSIRRLSDGYAQLGRHPAPGRKLFKLFELDL
jgi:hypothetical protein